MTRRVVVTIGLGQCISWGVLYYAFGVLLLPLEADLGVARWVVTGAFSLALFTSAVLAPTVGRWSDRGHGAVTLAAAAAAAAVLLVAWALMPSVTTLYLVWAAIGVCMAGTLYEPAFAIVGRALADPTERLEALAIVTVLGGLASTIFLPLTALLIRGVGWRGAVLVLAAVLTASAALSWMALRHGSRTAATSSPATHAALVAPAPARHFIVVLSVFSLASLASSGFVVNLVPALGAKGIPLTPAATLGGLLGIMQLPGRALVMRGGLTAAPHQLLLVSLLLQGAGLATFGLAGSAVWLGVGISVFAIGAGLGTLIRPHLIQTMFGLARAGHLNGRVAQAQQLARAAGPVIAVWLAATTSYAVVFTSLGVAFAALAVGSHRTLGVARR